MDKLYDKISKELIKELESFINGDISFEELEMVNEKEKLVRSNWDEKKKEFKNCIFENTKKLWENINVVEAKVNELEEMMTDKFHDVDIEEVVAHAQILGRNRIAPIGAENSTWHVPPYPNPVDE